jgi:hypothetical protein
VAALDRLGRFTTGAVQARPNMESTWTRARHRLDVRLVVIGHDVVWNHASPLDGLAKEGLGTGCVAVLAQEHIDDHTILVDRAVQLGLLPRAGEQHFIDEPALADGTSVSTYLGRQLRPECLDPVEDGAVRDVDAALGH